MRTRTRRRTRQAHGVAHPANLAIAALVDGDPQQLVADEGNLGRRRAAVLQVNPLAQPPQRAPRGPARNLCQVFLVDPERWVRQSVGQFAVVGEEQQPLGLRVEPAHGKHARLAGHESDHGRAPLGIRRGGDHSRRLVEQVVNQARSDPQDCAVDLDAVGLGIGPIPQARDLTVDPYPPRCDQRLGGAAAAQTGAGQDLLQPL